MHLQASQFFEKIKKKIPEQFRNVSVIDFGSLDVNGSFKNMFEDSNYIGIDIRPGKNVDAISKAHEYRSMPVDVVISGQMLEHDEYWMQSLLNMYRLLKDGGLMVVSAAGWATFEHGTERSDNFQFGTKSDYYKGILEDDIKQFLSRLPKPFKESGIEIGNVGQDIYFYGIKSSMKILCSISTKNRYDNYLAMAMASIAHQTRKPNHFTLYDDNDNPKDLREIEAYKYLFRLFDVHGITWNVMFGKKKGQHYNHQEANKTGYDAVFRLDDDCVAEPDVLEKLEAQMTSDVGAVGCSILTPPLPIFKYSSSLITELNVPNKQWSLIGITEEVDHLNCSFLYRAGIVDYDLRLSKVAHREETMFTYAMKLKGYKILITPGRIWHFKSTSGGIRSDNDVSLYQHDEQIFTSWLGFAISKQFLVVLNNGKGDHLVFKKAILSKLKEQYKNIVLAVCYPELFPDEKTISIADAMQMTDIEQYDVYKLGVQLNWQGSLASLYEKLYKL